MGNRIESRRSETQIRATGQRLGAQKEQKEQNGVYPCRITTRFVAHLLSKVTFSLLDRDLFCVDLVHLRCRGTLVEMLNEFVERALVSLRLTLDLKYV